MYAVAVASLSLLCAASRDDADVRMLKTPPAANARLAAPLVYWQESWRSPRPVRFHFLRLDLASPDYEVCTIVADDPDGDGPAEARLESPLTLLARSGAVAAVNANAFSHLPGVSAWERLRGWYKGKPVGIAGLAVADGTVRSTGDARLSAFWVDKAGKARVGVPERLESVQQGVANWIDGLLVNGKVVARKSKAKHPRTLVGVSKGSRYLLLVVADGRQRDYSEGVSLPEAAQLMLEHGCHDAVNLDGGGSSIMLAAGERGPRVLNRPSGLWPRPVPVMLGVRRRSHK